MGKINITAELNNKGFSYIKFCFTFLESNGKAKARDYENLFEKMQKISKFDPYILMGMGKCEGIEKIEVKKAEKLKNKSPKICEENRVFTDRSWKDSKVSIFRFGGAKSLGRVIGYVNNKHFYVLYIDPASKLYNH